MVLRFPGVITLWVSFPLDQVLQHPLFPMTLVASYGLDFVLFFVINKVRWRSRVVLAVFFCFGVWSEEGRVEYGVYGPLRRQSKLIGYWGHLSHDLEGPMTSGG